MEEKSLINMLFLAQRDIFKTIKDSKKGCDLFHKLCELDREFRNKLADYPELKDLYENLDETQTKYASEIEQNLFRYGFKSGLQIAIECGLQTQY